MKRKANQIDKTIGQNLEIQRKIARKSRKDIGAKFNLSQQQIQYYETGKNMIAASFLFELANYFKVNINKFFK